MGGAAFSPSQMGRTGAGPGLGYEATGFSCSDWETLSIFLFQNAYLSRVH